MNDGASDLIYPLLPLYLTSVLMAGPRALGLIEGMAEATASLLKLVSGVLSDRGGHSRAWIVAGYSMAAFSRPLLALAASWPVVLLLRLTDRLGKGLRSSPRDALLASSVEPKPWGLAFGLHRAMDNAGAVLGPLLASGLLAMHQPLRQIIAGALVPGVICIALTFTLPEADPASQGAGLASSTAPQAQPHPPANRWELRRLPLPLRRCLLVVGLFTLGKTSNLFLLLRARELGLSEARIPLLWAGLSAVAMLGSAPLAGWSDRVGRRRLLVAGYASHGVVYLGMSLLQESGLWLYPLFAGYGLVLAATEGVEKALVADLARPAERGTAFGWFHLISGVALLPASLLFGWLMQGFGPAIAFASSAGWALLAAALLASIPLGAERSWPAGI